MNLSIKKLLLFIFLIACQGNTQQTEEEALLHYLENFERNTDGIQAVLVLTELGCPNCNKSFANFLEKHASNPDLLCILTARGTVVDISPFVKQEQILFDFDNHFYNTGISVESCVIFLEAGILDTVVKIQAKGIEETFAYLEGRFE